MCDWIEDLYRSNVANILKSANRVISVRTREPVIRSRWWWRLYSGKRRRTSAGDLSSKGQGRDIDYIQSLVIAVSDHIPCAANPRDVETEVGPCRYIRKRNVACWGRGRPSR